MDKEEPCEKSSLPKLPPKSRFNDEESTAVLRLLLKQERFLKDKDNPALTLTPGKTSKQLPPVSRDHEGTNDERGMMRENILPVASHQGCSSSLRYLDPLPGRKAATDGTGSEEGNFRSAKLAKAKESQKESYRRQQQPQQQQILRRQRSQQETISKLKEAKNIKSRNLLLRARSCPDSDQLSEYYSPKYPTQENISFIPPNR